MQTRVQRQIVPQYVRTDPQLAKKLDELESEAQRIFISHFGVDMPDARPSKATLVEFLTFLLHLGRSRRNNRDIEETGTGQPATRSETKLDGSRHSRPKTGGRIR